MFSSNPSNSRHDNTIMSCGVRSLEIDGVDFMNVYAIFSEHGAGSIREELEMICISREVADSYLESYDNYWRNAYIEEMDVFCVKYEKPKPKKR